MILFLRVPEVTDKNFNTRAHPNMLHSHNKRIIYESDDDSNDVRKVTKGETISSDVKRIICESDDESCDMRGNNHPDGNILSGSSRSNLKRKSSDDCGRVTVDNCNDDDGVADCEQNLTEDRRATLRQTRSSFLSSSDDTPQRLRRSKRSAVANVDNRNLHLTKAKQAESMDSLQSLPMSTIMSVARSQRKSTAQNDEEEVDSVDDEETPDSESDSSTYDDENSDESQEETGGSRNDRRKSSKTEKHPRSYVTTRSQCDATASRMSSDRSQALSLAKEAERDTLLKKMKRRLSAGESALDAISSSEEEEEEGEEEIVKGKPPTGLRGIDSKKKVNDGTNRHQQSQPNTPGQHQRTSNGSQSSSRSSRPMSGSSAFIRKEVLPERYNSDEDENDDCVDDFIVGSDEERDEQRREMEDIAREREKRHKRKEKEKKRKAEEASIAIRKAEKERIKADKIELERMRQQHSETKSRRRKVIVEDDDEEEGEGAGEGAEERKREGLSAATTASPFEGASLPQGTSSSSRKRAIYVACSKQAGSRSESRIEIVLSSDEEGMAKLIPNDDVEEESEDENSSTEDEGDEEDEEDEESLDGPMLYRRVDAMREELEEGDANSTSIMKVSQSIKVSSDTFVVATRHGKFKQLGSVIPTSTHCDFSAC